MKRSFLSICTTLILFVPATGNLLGHGGTGVSPYEVTGLIPETGQPAYRQRAVTYNSFDRPVQVSEDIYLATLDYDDFGDRVKMAVRTTSNTHLLIRYYTGHEYLPWFGLINANARLYDPLLGRFLSPDPYVQDPGFTQNYNRYSYCLNNPLKYTDESGHIIGTMLLIGGISALVFGAGNLAAHAIREDDLSNGRWAKYFFSVALAGFVVGATTYAGISGLAALAAKGSTLGLIGQFGLWGYAGLQGTAGVASMVGLVGGAIHDGWQGVANAGKIALGNYYLDENKSFFGQVREGVLRHTWEFPQQSLGYSWAEVSNCWADRIDYWGGATFVTNFTTNTRQGVTIGSNIYIDNSDKAVMDSYVSFDDYMLSGEYMPNEYYVHEYGHTIQSKKWGPAYLAPGFLSLWNCRERLFTKNKIAHDDYWTEVWANTYSKNYFKKYFSTFAFPSTLKVKY